MMNQDVVTAVIINQGLGSEEVEPEENEEDETVITYADHSTDELEEAERMHDFENENDDYEDEEEDEPVQFSIEPVPFQKQQFRKFPPPLVKQEPGRQQATRPPLSTHVLDTTRGAAVAGLQVSLYKLIEGRWTYINEGVTGSDGRFSQFLDSGDFTPGRYKLHYDVDRYFEARKVDTLYPFIEIVMDCKGGNESYHIPLLISPFGYTTYRGT